MNNHADLSAPMLGVSCLSGEGGRYELAPEARNLMCLLDNGELYAAGGYESSHWLLALMDKLRRDDYLFVVKVVGMEQIAQLYRTFSHGSKKESNSSRQEEVIALINKAAQRNASDIHLIVRGVTTLIKLRIDGELLLENECSAEDGRDMCATIYQTMCDVAEPMFNPRRSQDARLMNSALEKCGLYGGRIATRPTDSGLLMVIRLLYAHSQSRELEGLGYLPAQVTSIRRMARRRVGINLLSGPTGSGKSSTLESVLKLVIALRQDKAHVLTLEDPPEYRIEGAVQTPILCEKDDDEAINREWARSISNALRLDPDVLMCGEIRDLFSAKATFRAAMTGHAVWTTVHSNDALGSLLRLQEIGVSPALLADPSLVTGLISQMLVRTLCPQCSQPYCEGSGQYKADLRQRVERCCDISQVRVLGEGCDACGGRGIAGRTVVAEVIEPTAQLMDIFFREGKNQARVYWLHQMDGKSKNHSLIALINQGRVDPAQGEMDVCMLDDDLICGEQHHV
ncbi:GspE/PulE family protein [Serratia quinivorans]|uniref:GspE/PulE family protein n=1 Tax=Serratia quinivorans TaxID=137545 RepID=UPI002177795C|nr:ATPase, T2SS/T4P/T4SS family [Serratia quinivorans]CAI1007483.1 Type II traffic warden ATPase [Serratia quinivorans]CAI1807999.1 Type II traffic warden ATPase [Serratia quinivorans]